MSNDEIINLCKAALGMLDIVDEAHIKSKETGEDVDVLTKNEVLAIQATLCLCGHMLEGDYAPQDSLKFVNDIIGIHSANKMDRLKAEACDD